MHIFACDRAWSKVIPNIPWVKPIHKSCTMLFYLFLRHKKKQKKIQNILDIFHNFTKHFYRTDLDFDLEKEAIISLVNWSRYKPYNIYELFTSCI